VKRKRKDRERAAFTLIEVLVATFILVIMILILGKVYHQASVAWSAGFRRAEGNMTGRSAVGFMAREIMNGCADSNIFWDAAVWVKPPQNASIRIITLSGEADTGERVAKWVKYRVLNEALMRQEKYPNPNDYGEWLDYSPPREWCLATNVASCTFSAPGATTFANGKLPGWVHIQLTMNRKDDVSAVGAASAGPDGILGGSGKADDVRSY
jgi:hypothetical protein